MSIQVNWSDPYADREGRWFRGNLHAHTCDGSACGTMPTAEVLAAYAAAGYDFLAVSDHMTLNWPDDPPLTLIPGIEWNSASGQHTGLYSLDRELLARATAVSDQSELLSLGRCEGALTVLNHPNWQRVSHYRREALLTAARGADAVEVYNHVIERLDGAANAWDKWDYLLAEGCRVLGVASDDSHVPGDIGRGAVVVRARQCTPPAILSALRSGNFYASSGATIDDVGRRGQTIELSSPDGQEVQAIGPGGVLLARQDGGQMCWDLDAGGVPFVRFAVYGRGSAMAWTQPFYR